MIRLIKLGNFIYENIEPKMIDENGNEIWNVPNDELALKTAFKDTIDWYTDRYIKEKFEQQQENLADIVSEQGVIEGRFYLAGFSPEQVRNEIFLIITGQKTRDEVITGLSIPAELEPQLDRAIEIAKLIYWKEKIWEAEANLEAQVDTMTFDELLSLDVKAMCENAYEVIQL